MSSASLNLRLRTDAAYARHESQRERASLLEEAAAAIERLTETIRAFGRGNIVPIADTDAEIERLRAALRLARKTLIGLRTPLEADKNARGEAIVQINLALGEHPAGPFKADSDEQSTRDRENGP